MCKQPLYEYMTSPVLLIQDTVLMYSSSVNDLIKLIMVAWRAVMLNILMIGVSWEFSVFVIQAMHKDNHLLACQNE